jgi:hypothetical protein
MIRKVPGAGGRMEGEQVQYQPILRALGAYLEDESARFISVIETNHGFTALYERDSGGGGAGTVEFTYDQLVDLFEELKRRPKPPAARREPGTLPRSYQDVFRAIGFELEQVPAHQIMLDELDDAYLLTYSYLNPLEGYMWRKTMARLGPPQVEEILTTSYKRRNPKNKKFLDRFR